jgi:hypothetical protein
MAGRIPELVVFFGVLGLLAVVVIRNRNLRHVQGGTRKGIDGDEMDSNAALHRPGKIIHSNIKVRTTDESNLFQSRQLTSRHDELISKGATLEVFALLRRGDQLWYRAATTDGRQGYISSNDVIRPQSVEVFGATEAPTVVYKAKDLTSGVVTTLTHPAKIKIWSNEPFTLGGPIGWREVELESGAVGFIRNSVTITPLQPESLPFDLSLGQRLFSNFLGIVLMVCFLGVFGFVVSSLSRDASVRVFSIGVGVITVLSLLLKRRR